jgi:acyl-CoA synthetase (AMP-forming)/AMP-acid ligase II
MGHSQKNLPLGHWGEIIFRKSGRAEFTHTGLYGFFDQRGRIWCCGRISDTIFLGGQRYFPHCIEPLFERLWWVERAQLKCTGEAKGQKTLQICAIPRMLLRWPVKIFENFFLEKMEAFSRKFRISSAVKKFAIKNFDD